MRASKWFCLNSQRLIYMRKSYFKVLCAAIVAIVVMLNTSCEKESGVKFPEAQSFTCTAGEKLQLTFTAEADWQLSSDALWCKFITPNGMLQDMAGKAGSHNITLQITDDIMSNATSTAKITITMRGKGRTLAIIERSAEVLFVKLTDSEGNATDSLEIGYDEYIATTIEANFRFAAADIPEWVEVARVNSNGKVEVTNAISGYAGEKIEVLLRIVKDGEREKSRITLEDNILIDFIDEQRSETFSFPIIFDGMGANYLTFEGPSTNSYGWEVSFDGKTFRHYDEVTGSTTDFKDELQYTITAQDNEYEVLFFEQHIERGISSYEYLSNSWMAFDKEAMTLHIDEHSIKPRYGVVMALPMGIYDSIKEDVMDIFEEDISAGIALPAIKGDYTKFILIDFVQHELNSDYKGMYAYHSISSLEIFCEPYTDTSLTEKYGVEEIYRCGFVNPVEGKIPGIIVNPLIEGWQTASYEKGSATAEVWHGDTQLKISENEYYIGENTDEELSVHLWGPKGGWNGEDVIVVFKLNGENKKILVVTPPTK